METVLVQVAPLRAYTSMAEAMPLSFSTWLQPVSFWHESPPIHVIESPRRAILGRGVWEGSPVADVQQVPDSIANTADIILYMSYLYALQRLGIVMRQIEFVPEDRFVLSCV